MPKGIVKRQKILHVNIPMLFKKWLLSNSRQNLSQICLEICSDSDGETTCHQELETRRHLQS